MPEILPVRTTSRDAQRTYDRLSRIYDRTEGVFERSAIRRAVDLAAVRPGEAALEIGPGPGRALARLAAAVGANGAAVGVDLAPGMLREARRRCDGHAMLALGDATRLPVAGDRFDLVFMSFVLELLPTDAIAIALTEIRRVLKPGGRFVNLSLTRDSPNLMTRLYERGHALFPRLLDCRPIYAASSAAAAGFEIGTVRRIGVWGLPADIVLARKAEDGI